MVSNGYWKQKQIKDSMIICLTAQEKIVKATLPMDTTECQDFQHVTTTWSFQHFLWWPASDLVEGWLYWTTSTVKMVVLLFLGQTPVLLMNLPFLCAMLLPKLPPRVMHNAIPIAVHSTQHCFWFRKSHGNQRSATESSCSSDSPVLWCSLPPWPVWLDRMMECPCSHSFWCQQGGSNLDSGGSDL